jgi:hypothetical protein
MPTWFYEAVAAPIAVALAFRHAARALGPRRAALEMAALAAYGFALEAVSMAVFASHRYDASWRVAPLGVPLAVAGVWAAIIVAAMAVAWRYGSVSPAARAATAALTGVTLDMMIEPVATRVGLWEWTPPGPWLGVPIGNFVGWAVIVGVYAWGAERWAGAHGAAQAIVRRLALAGACIGVLVAVGLVWTRLGLERAFEDDRGWLVWGLVLVATVSSRWWPHGRPGTLPPSLPEQLAAAPGHGPQAVLLVLGFAFLFGANRAGDEPVLVVAVGSLIALRMVAGVRRQEPEQ